MQKIGIVIPCYNEENRIDINVLHEFVRTNTNYHFHFVNDGSSDDTVQFLGALLERNGDNFSLSSLATNVGKGNAVRKGILSLAEQKVKYDLVGFLDADLSTPVSELPRLVRRFAENEHLIQVSGIRLKKMGSTITRSGLRHYMGRIFATVTSVLYKIDNYDTQCGAKLFRCTTGMQVFDTVFLSRWLFDIEIFLRIRAVTGRERYLTAVEEVPLSVWNEKRHSKIKWYELVMIPVQLVKIYFKYNDRKAR